MILRRLQLTFSKMQNYKDIKKTQLGKARDEIDPRKKEIIHD